jgi:hypothetical protein
MYRKYGTGCVFDDALGRAPHEELSQLRMTPSAHHDHIDIALSSEFGHDLRRVSAFDDHLDSIPPRP